MTKTTKTNKFICIRRPEPAIWLDRWCSPRGGARREGVHAARGCTPRGGARDEGVLTMRGCSSCEVQPF